MFSDSFMKNKYFAEIKRNMEAIKKIRIHDEKYFQGRKNCFFVRI